MGNLLQRHRPLRSLTVAFALWKLLLLLVLAACPGPGYDTSTTLLAGIGSLRNLVRWDPVYFVHIAEQGYVFEQEWAFGYPRLQSDSPSEIALVGVALSHLSHYLSVLVLYGLSVTVLGRDTPAKERVCLLAAALHIITPAGAFLSAPYGEPLFALLNFAGYYVYSSSTGPRRVGRLLGAAALFAVATTVRSNGILSGFLFASDAVRELHALVVHGCSVAALARLLLIVIGGCLVALGFVGPQLLAYRDYCLTDTPRPWCQQALPSIYAWVQEEYWNVGFLRYWTVSNIPLFLLATPMLVILALSARWGVSTSSPISRRQPWLLAQLAIPQGLLALLALTSYHVQTINRISSGYPVWYWYLAHQAVHGRRGATPTIRLITVYALVQAGLYGSFLPPA
ncbi:hypothetical protein ASPZODRAFT_60509 [Penicilliopsis zonata CBS 506.65]|uniref:GPI mannosyltransferase 2 n=1 Tax=Penicilliopsis zonata CBS 506.65 TaxID=1073090 RepID=A0A1L9SQS7_9EURO|nr:hypothetical protein ASPZODRAFT_60509 [Penicilliopsis zonata CBS 506.65]OJJ49457.1 hypothetical protein ASPZODRAFT_60509 [Penicilliopsis zonata CBS 506.65]